MTEEVAAPEQQQSADGGQAAVEFSEPQKAALAEADRLKVEFLKATDSGEQDKLKLRIAELQRAGFGNGPLPAGLVPSDPDAAPDQREYDATQAAFERAQAAEQITPDQREAAINHAKVNGLDGADAAAVVQMAEDFGLNASAAKSLSERVATHVKAGWWGGDAPPLSDEDHVELFTEAARLAGGEDKLIELNSYARAWVRNQGKEQLVQQIGGSLAYDLHVLTAFAYKAKAAGLSPVED